MAGLAGLMGGAAGAEGAAGAASAAPAAGAAAADSGIGLNMASMSPAEGAMGNAAQWIQNANKTMKDNNIQLGGGQGQGGVMSGMNQSKIAQQPTGMGSPGVGESGNFDLMKAIQAQLAKNGGGGGYGGAGAM